MTQEIKKTTRYIFRSFLYHSWIELVLAPS